MKTTNFLAIAIIAVASVTSNVVAQRTTGKTSEATNTISSGGKQEDFLILANKTGWDLRTTEVRVVATEDGCEITCNTSNPSNNSGGGMAVGKQKNTKTENQIEPIKIKLEEVFVTSHQINDINEEPTTTEDGSFPGASVVSKKQATGKHFKEATIYMKSTANGTHIKEAKLSARQGGGSGKVNVQDLHFTVKCKGKPVAITIDNNGFTMPENCPDGTYDMVASWSWGTHQSGSTSNKAIDCHLKIENGVCVDMAINEKGTSGTKSTR